MSTWRGFERIDFEFEGHACILVKPEQAAEGNPWVWRAEFFDAFAQADEAMAKKGYHIAYVRLSDRYGCPSAVEDMERFRSHMVKEYGLHDKPLIFGFSRGGLYTVNYALTYPEHTGKIYIDAPVLDIRSWPGGKGRGHGSEACWQECMACYGLTEETAKTFDLNPLDRTEELAKTGIPVIIVAGGADETVPYEENGELFVKRFRAAGGVIEEYVKPECGHHPHSLEDPRPIVEFLVR